MLVFGTISNIKGPCREKKQVSKPKATFNAYVLFRKGHTFWLCLPKAWKMKIVTKVNTDRRI